MLKTVWGNFPLPDEKIPYAINQWSEYGRAVIEKGLRCWERGEEFTPLTVAEFEALRA